MPMVQLKPGHPYAEYRRAGLVFTNEEQEVADDADGFDDIINDPNLLVDGKTFAQREAAKPAPEGEANPAEHETRSDGTTEVKVTEGGDADDTKSEEQKAAEAKAAEEAAKGGEQKATGPQGQQGGGAGPSNATGGQPGTAGAQASGNPPKAAS